MQAVEARIATSLDAIERDEDVVVLLAVESGSRAWGFPSADSDFDVRFVFAHRPTWYLSIDVEHRRNVIERPIDDALDVSGWDIRKALSLFRKSNPPLLEWLQCPIRYRERSFFAERLRLLLPDFYSPRASFHHYSHMARGNFREYLHGETVWRKKYFYVLRPLLAMLWIESGRGPVPIEFQRLVDAIVSDAEVRRAIDDLLEAKRAGAELDRGPVVPALSRFIESELTRLEQEPPERVETAPTVEKLDELFHSVLRDVWRGRNTEELDLAPS